MQAVQDPTETALSAAFLVQGPNAWPFDSSKQALFVNALQQVLPGVRPGAITVTSTGAPFRRRALLQVHLNRLLLQQTNSITWTPFVIECSHCVVRSQDSSEQWLQVLLEACYMRA
jgi:hypothetical protein